MNSTFVPLYMVSIALSVTIYPVGEYLGLAGNPWCYGIAFMEAYMFTYTSCHSFYISFYRYVCIVHNNLLLKLGLSAKVHFWVKN